MPEKPEKFENKWSEMLFKILAALVLPLLGWGVRLEVTAAVQAEKIASLEAEVTAAKSLKDSLNAQNVAMGRVEEKIDATNRRLEDIKNELRRGLPPGP